MYFFMFIRTLNKNGVILWREVAVCCRTYTCAGLPCDAVPLRLVQFREIYARLYYRQIDENKRI